MKRTNWRTFWLGLIAAVLAGLAVMITNGQVPIPREVAWLAPLAVVAITYATPKLREMAEDPGPETDSPPLSVPIPPSTTTLPRYPQFALPTPDELRRQLTAYNARHAPIPYKAEPTAPPPEVGQ